MEGLRLLQQLLKTLYLDINRAEDNFWRRPKKIVFLLLLFGFLFYFQYTILGLHPFMDQYVPCVEYLHAGDLYGGQPRCIQGPITYLFLLVPWVFFGVSQFFTFLLNYLFYFLLFFILVKIIHRYTKNYSFIFLSLLYILLLPLVIGEDSASLYATFFFVFSFYLLFISSLQYKHFFSGLALVFALHSKMLIFPYFILLIFLSFFLFLFRRHQLPSFDVTLLYRSFLFLFPLIFLTALLILLFPNLLVYTFFSQIAPSEENIHAGDLYFSPTFTFFKNPFSTPDFLKEYKIYWNRFVIIDETVLFVLFYLLSSLLLWFYNRKNILAIFSLFGFLFLFSFIFYRKNIFALRYYAPLFPFYIASLTLAQRVIKPFFIRRIILAMVGIIIFSLFAAVSYPAAISTEEFRDFVREVGSGISLLPSNITILTDNPNIFLEGGYPLRNSSYDVYPLKVDIDTSQTSVLANLGVLEYPWSYWQSLPYANEAHVVQRIVDRHYDVIFIGPNFYDAKLVILYLRIRDEIKNLGLEPKHYIPQCSVSIPTIYQSCFSCVFYAELLFKDPLLCKKMKDDLYHHYLKKFDWICQKDAFVANLVIKQTLHSNDTPLNKTCLSDADYFLRSTGAYGPLTLTPKPDFFYLSLFLIMGFFLFPLL